MRLLFALMLLQPAAAHAEAIGAAHASFATTIGANVASIGAFLSLACVSPEGKGSVTGLQAATKAAMSGVNSEYRDYMAFVTKPMEGNGKCDGGFRSVEIESNRRYQRSLEAARRVDNIANTYKAATMANLFGPIISVNNFGGDGCLETASSGYDGLEDGANRVLASIRSVASSLRFEAEKFSQYEAQNYALRMRCDEHQEILDGMIKSAAGEGSVTRDPASVPSGTSPRSASDITGTKEDAEKRAKAEAP